MHNATAVAVAVAEAAAVAVAGSVEAVDLVVEVEAE
jgi:hypothetical protein